MSMRVFASIAWIVACSLVAFGQQTAPETDPVYSGPQPGEPLVPFEVSGVSDDQAGKTFDPVAVADGRPTLLVFVHKLTRPGMALTRGLTNYANELPKASSTIIWLSDDKAKAESYLKRAAQSLNFNVPVGVSVDGGEGPGAYGLNRNVELTILIAKDNTVTANYALVQPSVSEGDEIAAELAKLVDATAPDEQAFARHAYPGSQRMRQRRMQQNNKTTAASEDGLRSLIRTLLDAEDDQAMQTTVKKIEAWVGDNKSRQAQLQRISTAVLERGLGSENVQRQLRQWKSGKSRDDKDDK